MLEVITFNSVSEHVDCYMALQYFPSYIFSDKKACLATCINSEWTNI